MPVTTRRTVRPPRLPAAVLGVTAALLLAGCGEDTPEVPELAQVEEELDRLGSQARDAVSDVEEALEGSPLDEEARTRAAEAATAAEDALTSAGEALEQQTEDAGPEAEQAAEDARTALSDAGQRLDEALEGTDGALRSALESLRSQVSELESRLEDT